MLLSLYTWQLPEQSRNSLTVYLVSGFLCLVCGPGLKLRAWQPAQSGW